eukprot:CAMPEP_0116868712 /NCGR_PEP_ID=MMETSP0418-20121206/27353_1 /TAXON_ID=1158023 /ORGANISM="Astrosyne radiata, Strain 13vi08-1A" /LENGTH=98 /DNA_ID=CAMNT_0004504721 /DNA_START=21 /DNA_END=317 /DNA_ORIENTATION=+
MAVAHYRAQEYSESEAAYSDAVDIYENVVEKGKNPILDGLENMAQQQQQQQIMQQVGIGPDGNLLPQQQQQNDQQGGDVVIDLDSFRASLANATQEPQ